MGICRYLKYLSDTFRTVQNHFVPVYSILYLCWTTSCLDVLLSSPPLPITYFSSSPERPICANVAAEILFRPLRTGLGPSCSSLALSFLTRWTAGTAADGGSLSLTGGSAGFSLAGVGGSFSLAEGGTVWSALARRILAMRAAVAAAVGAAVPPGDSAEAGGCCFKASAKENCLQNIGEKKNSIISGNHSPSSIVKSWLFLSLCIRIEPFKTKKICLIYEVLAMVYLFCKGAKFTRFRYLPTGLDSFITSGFSFDIIFNFIIFTLNDWYQASLHVPPPTEAMYLTDAAVLLVFLQIWRNFYLKFLLVFYLNMRPSENTKIYV